jgi:hypothetical protein
MAFFSLKVTRGPRSREQGREARTASLLARLPKAPPCPTGMQNVGKKI